MKKNICRALCIGLAALSLTACSAMDKGTKEYNEGVASMKAGNYEKACELIGAAIAKNTEEPLYYVSYGTALVQLKKYDEATSSYEKALKASAKTKNQENIKRAYRGLGISYYQLGKYKEAEENLKKALEISGLEDLNMELYMFLGSSYDALGDANNAIETYRSAIETDKTRISAYVSKYKAEIALDKAEEAEKTLEQGLMQSPKTEEDTYMYARLCFYNKDYDKAQSGMDKATKSYPESYQYLGQIYYQQKKFKKAVESYETYYKKSKAEEDFAATRIMAECYSELKKYKDAIQYYENALKLTENEAELMDMSYAIVEAYEANGDHDKAYELCYKYQTQYMKDDRYNEFMSNLKLSGTVSAEVIQKIATKQAEAEQKAREKAAKEAAKEAAKKVAN